MIVKTKKNICFVTNEFDGIDPNGGIGTYYREISIFLKKNGWDVVVLYQPVNTETSNNAKIESFGTAFIHEYDIPFFDARILCREFGDEDEIKRFNASISENDAPLSQSHLFHQSLQVLETKYGYIFDLIEFHDWNGIGIIPTRMKKIGGCYKNSKIMVKLHSPNTWIKESMLMNSMTFQDIGIDFLNRYSFENADIQVSPTRHLIAWCRNHGWKVRDDVSLCRNSVPPSHFQFPKDLTKRNKIVYFGRYEIRKGIVEFINALNYIKKINPDIKEKYSLIFVGRESPGMSRDSIKFQLKGYNIEFHSFIEREDALGYIRENARLAVMPSLQDNYPYTVLECMSLGIPFMTSRCGGIPEIIGTEGELYDSISCDITDPKRFGDLVIRYLGYPEEFVFKLLTLANNRLNELADPGTVLHWYETNVGEAISPTADHTISLSPPDPWVTILIPTMNTTTEMYLEKTLLSLSIQTYNNLKIIINDASTEPKALARYDSLTEKYRDNQNMVFIHQEHHGIGNALNQVLPLADTKYVMEVDGDNLAKPEMVEIFVRCMENHDKLAALSCYYRIFFDNTESEILESFTHKGDRNPILPHYLIYSPIGPCLPLLFFENVMGDANSIYLTDVVKKVGGWPESRKGYQDWAMWLKLLTRGYDLDVIPKVLYFYRDHPGSDKKNKKLLWIDDNNIKYIKTLLKTNPEEYSYLYTPLHRMVRNSQTSSSPLQYLGITLGRVSARSPLCKKFFVISGTYLKRVLDKL
jgi:glycosyltransferase involved in cell wall biosynthesis